MLLHRLREGFQGLSRVRCDALLVLAAIGAASPAPALAQKVDGEGQFQLKVALNTGQPQAIAPSILKSWTPADFEGFKRASSRERDPESGEIAQWRGVLISQLVDKAIEQLTVEQRAQIDLVILRNAAGVQAFLPRSLVTKYPVMLVSHRNGKPLAPSSGGPLYSVVPWTSKPGVSEEELPIERYFVPGVSQIELTNYRNLYSDFFLKRRTDPLAVRGEKIFVQTCLSCHGTQQAPSLTNISDAKTRSLASEGHPRVKGFPKLQDRDRRAVISYLEAFRAESPLQSGAGPQVSRK